MLSTTLVVTCESIIERGTRRRKKKEKTFLKKKYCNQIRKKKLTNFIKIKLLVINQYIY
jgi:hypothetical protein